MLRRWRKVAESYDPPRVLIGETYVLEPEAFASFYGAGDELNLAFNFMLLHSELPRRAICATRSSTPSGSCPAHAWPVWTGGNHDNHRFPTRWCDGDPQRTRAALVMLMGLRGHAVPLLRRRDRHDRHRTCPRIASSIRSVCSTARGWAATTSARRCNGRRGPARASPPPASSRGSRTATTRAYNVADQRHDPDSDAVAHARPHRVARRLARAARRHLHHAARAERRRVGVAARRAHRRRLQSLGRARRGRRRRTRRDPDLHDPCARRRTGRRLAPARRRGRPRSSGATHDRHRAVDPGARRRARRSRSTGPHSVRSTSSATEDGAGVLQVAQLWIGGADFWIQTATDVDAGAAGAPPVHMILSVDEPDIVFARALAAGARAINPMDDAYGWRIGKVADPFGHVLGDRAPAREREGRTKDQAGCDAHHASRSSALHALTPAPRSRRTRPRGRCRTDATRVAGPRARRC